MTGRLQPSIGFVTGTSYCVTIMVGAGVLGLPGAAARLAGPNAVWAWIADFLLALPLLFVFGKLTATVRSAGGIADFVKAAFGRGLLYRFVQGLLLVTLVLGTAAIAQVGGRYLAAPLGWGREATAGAAVGLVLLPALIVSRGVRLSGAFQSGAAVVLLLFLATVIASSFGWWRPSEVLAFDSTQIGGTWAAMGLVWFAFTGVEMISFLGEEFRSARVFTLSVATGFAVVGLLYVGLAVAVQQVVSPDDPLLVDSPLTAVLNTTMGARLAAWSGLLGGVLILINLNGAILGASRSILAIGREGDLLPRSLGELNARGVPARALLVLAGASVGTILVSESLRWPLEGALRIVSQNWFLLYVLSIVAFLRLEKRRWAKGLGVLALLLAAAFMSVFSWYLLVPALILALVRVLPSRQGADDPAGVAATKDEAA